MKVSNFIKGNNSIAVIHILACPEVIKLFSCSAQLRLKFILLITIVGILTFMSRINYRSWHYKPSISIYLGYFHIYEEFKFYAGLSLA